MTNPTQPAEGMPERWQLVPVEPTREMFEAAKGDAVLAGNMAEVFRRGLLLNWRAMLDAAPKAPPMPDEVRLAVSHLRSLRTARMLDLDTAVLLDWLAAQGFTKE